MLDKTMSDIDSWRARTVTARAWLAGEYAYEWASRVAEQGPSFVLRLAAHNPEDAYVVREVFSPSFRTLAAMTHGRLRIEPVWEGSSHALPEGWAALRERKVEMTACYSSRSPELGFKLVQGLTLPGLFDSAALGTLTAELLHRRYLKPEYDRQGVRLGRFKATGQDVIFTREPIEKKEDMVGLRIYAGGGWHGAIYREMGATVVPLYSPQVREALRAGEIDAAAMTDGSAQVFGVDTVARFRLDSGLGRQNLEYCLAPDAYDELPGDLQAALSAWLCGLGQAECQVFYGLGGAHARAAFAANGMQTTVLDEDERQRWQQPIQRLRERYVAEMEAEGLPGRQFMDDLLGIVDRFSSADENQLMQRAIYAPVPALNQA